MKLYLSSLGIPNPQAYLSLFAKKRNPQVALVTNAWGTYPAERAKPYIDAVKDQFKAMGITIESLDLLEYGNKHDELQTKLSGLDGMWVTGGNSYYLNWAIHQSSLHKIIHGLCDKGFVYGGESAGAIVAGPTLNHFQEADDPNEAPEVILDGMRLTDVVIVPHADNPKYGDIMRNIESKLRSDGNKVTPLGDSQVLVIDGNREEIR